MIMYLLERWMIILLVFGFALSLNGQNNFKVQYENPASSPDFLNACGNSDVVRVSVRLDGPSPGSRSEITASLDLFEGIEMVSFDVLSSTAGVVLIDDSDPGNPVFELPDMSPGNLSEVVLELEIVANCELVDTIRANDNLDVFDTWSFNYVLGGQSFTESDQNTGYRDALAITVLNIDIEDDVIKRRVGDCFERKIIISNGAISGFTDSVHYENIQGKDIFVSNVRVNGFSVPFNKVPDMNGDTIIQLDIAGMIMEGNTVGSDPGNGDGFLDPDESITIVEEICILSCDEARGSTHLASWGCFGSLCNEVLISDFVILGDGAPQALILESASIADIFTGYCQTGVEAITILNDGTEIDPGFGAMTDIQAGIGLTLDFLLDFPPFSITSLTIAGVDLTGQLLVDLDQHASFDTDPDGPGGLTDIDNDGFYDDLEIGESFEIRVTYEFDCSLAKGSAENCRNDFSFNAGATVNYLNPCGERETRNAFNPPIFGAQNTLGEVSSTNRIRGKKYATDAIVSQDTFFINHFLKREVRNFERDCNGEEEIHIKVVPPAGILPYLDSTFIDPNELVLIDTVHIGDTILYRVDATQLAFTSDLDIEFQMAFITDCDAVTGIPFFPYEFAYVCPPCDCEHTWYCDTLQGPYLHNLTPPCPQGLVCDQGLQTIDFEVLRTTFGYTDDTYSTKVNPDEIIRIAGIPCDSVQMTLTNLVGNTPIDDSIGVVIHYDNVDMLPGTEEIFLFDSGELIIKNNNGSVAFPVSSDQLTVSTPGISKVLRFDLNDCLDLYGQSLNPGDTLIFKGNFAINTEGQMLKEFELVPDLRAYAFGTIDGTDYACDNFGAPFLVAKKSTIFATPPSFSFVRGCAQKNIDFAIQCFTIGTIDEFFPNEFRPSAKVDSIKFNYDPNILESFSTFDLFVKIPGHPIHGDSYFSIPNFSIDDNGEFVAYFDTLSYVPSLNIGIKPWSLRIEAVPNCKASFGSTQDDNLYDLHPTVYFTDRYYAKNIGDGSCAPYEVISKTSRIRYEDQPQMTLSILSEQNIGLVNDTAEWTFRHCNFSETAIGWTWFALEDGNGEIEVISIELIDDPNNPVSLPTVDYGPNGINTYALTGNLAGVQLNSTTDDICNTFRVRAIVNTCEKVDLTARAGWNCEDDLPPDWNPAIYPPCEDELVQVSAFTPNPFLDVEIINQPTVLAPCDTNTITILVKNTTGGTAYDLRTRLVFPDSSIILIPNGVEIAYPPTAAFVPALSDPVLVGSGPQGDIYEYPDFSDLNAFLASDGLPGFDPVNTTDSLNSFKLRFEVIADCPFENGSLAFYSFQGKNRCGELSNLEAGETFPLMIDASDPGAWQPVLTQNGMLFPNGTGTLQVDLTNTSAIISSGNDHVEVTLPSGIDIIPGSAIGFSPISWTPGDPDIIVSGGQQTLTWVLPAGIEPGELVSFTFDVQVDDTDCDQLLDAFIKVYNEQLISCPNLGSVCEIVTQTSDRGEVPLLIECGRIMGMLTPVDTSVCPGEEVPLLASGGDTFQWLASSDNPPNGSLTSFNTADPVFTGGLSDEQYKFTVIISESGSGFVPDTIEAIISIYQAPQVEVEIEPSATVCIGQDVTLSATGAASYAWYTQPANDLISTEESIIVTADETTEYRIVGISAEGCSDTAVAVVEVSNDVLDIKVKKNEASCGLTNGAIKLEVLGGSGNYSYDWDPNVSDMNDAFNLPAGIYSVTVTDLETGCTGTETIEIIQKPGPEIILSTTKASCDAADGSIQVQIINGTPTFKIEWTGPENGSVVDVPGPDYIITGLPSGTYTVAVTDLTGCTVSEIVYVDRLLGDLDIKTKKNEASCGLANGAIKIEVLSGSGDYTYEWDPDVSDTHEAFNLAAGIYTVTVTDNETGCIAVDTIEILDKAGPAIQISTTKASCDASDGSIFVEITGGIPPYKIMWDGPVSGEEVNVPGPNYMIDSIPGGQYTITVIDLAGCTISEMVFVDRIDGDLDVKVKKNDATCGMANGIIEVEVLFGSGNYSYTWNPPVSTGPKAVYLEAGIYSVTVEDLETGCLAEDTIEIIDKPGPEIDLGATKTTCGEDNGMIQVFIQGGIPNYSVSWDGPESGLVENISGPEFNITNLPAGDYLVIVIDQVGCEKEATATIGDSDNNLHVVSIDTKLPGCNSSDGSIELDINGNQGALTYEWMPNVSSSNIAQDLAAGSYLITVTDGQTECSLELNVNLSDSSSLQVMVSTTDPSCSDDNGIIDLAIIGGKAPFMIEWSGPVSDIVTIQNSNYSLSDLPAGIYELSVTDSDGCKYSIMVELMQSGNPVDDVLTSVVSDTCGRAVGRIELEVISSATNLVYEWSPEVSDSSSADNLTAGLYSITVSEAGNDCIYSLEVNVDDQSSLEVDLLTEDASCGSADGAINIEFITGTPPYDINLSGPVNELLSGVMDNQISINELGTGSYYLEIIASDSCIFTASFEINVDFPGLDFQNYYEVCQGESLTLSAMGPYQFFWFENGLWIGSGNSILIEPEASGEYQLLVSDGICSDTFDVEVMLKQPPQVVDITESLSNCDGDTLQAQIQFDQAISSYDITGGNFYGDELIGGTLLQFYTVYQGSNSSLEIVATSESTGCIIQTTIEISECMDDEPCDYFGGMDDVVLDGGSCEDGTLFCLDISLDSIDAFDVSVDGNLIDNFDVCNADSAGSYALNKLFNLGSFGPYYVDSWTVDGQEFSGPVDDVMSLLDSMNTWDPQGNWSLAFSNTILVGGNSGSVYDTLIIVAPGFGTAYLLYNESLIGGDAAILLSSGDHTVIIGDQTGCEDTLMVLVECDNIVQREIVDTILVYVDTVEYCLNTDALPGSYFTIEDMCEDLNGNHVVFDPDDQNICVTYSGFDIGTDTACYRVMDEFGNMLEVGFYVHVRPPQPALIQDEILVGDTETYCLDLSELAADIVSVDNFCPGQSGVSVDFDPQLNTLCVDYTGLTPGTENACIVYCDENAICDTVYMQVEVIEDNNPPETMVNDDCDLTATQNQTSTFDLLANDSISGPINSLEILGVPIYGTYTVDVDNNLVYTADDLCEETEYLQYEVCTDEDCDTAEICIYIECEDIIIYTGFSPNNDGVNDHFHIAGIDMFPDNELFVYNRWGNLVYHTESYDNTWEGEWFDRGQLPSGTYFYVLKLNDTENRSFTGYIQLMR